MGWSQSTVYRFRGVNCTQLYLDTPVVESTEHYAVISPAYMEYTIKLSKWAYLQELREIKRIQRYPKMNKLWTQNKFFLWLKWLSLRNVWIVVAHRKSTKSKNHKGSTKIGWLSLFKTFVRWSLPYTQNKTVTEEPLCLESNIVSSSHKISKKKYGTQMSSLTI